MITFKLLPAWLVAINACVIVAGKNARSDFLPLWPRRSVANLRNKRRFGNAPSPIEMRIDAFKPAAFLESAHTTDYVTFR